MSRPDQGWIDVEKRDRSIVAHQTWGHLFPEAKYYEGKIVVAQTVYGETVVISEAIDIPGSPWWAAALSKFMDDLLDAGDLEEGQVWEFAVSASIDTVDDEDGGETINIRKLAGKKLVG